MKSPLRKVMVPLDGSPLSQQALSIGVSIARQERAELHVITVVAPLAHDSIVEAALHDGYRRYLSGQAEAVGRLEPEVTLVHRVLDGGVVDALARYARDEDIDLIVMTTHGWGGLKRLWLGSVAQDVVHRVHCPVLLMRRAGEPQAFGLHRILVALESAEDAEVLLEPALSLGSLVEGAQYTLLQVVQLEPTLILRLAGIPDRSVRDWVGQIADEATCRVEGTAAGLRHRGIPAEARVTIERGAGEQILGMARRSGCDLIVVGTRASGLKRAAFGSVADKVVRGANQMVLVVPIRVESKRDVSEDEEAMPLAQPLVRA